jgi:hypothetical protein
VQVHPGTGAVLRRGDALLVVPALPQPAADPVRELLATCSRPDPTGTARPAALRALLERCAPAGLPGFALLVRRGDAVRLLVHGPVQVLLDGRPAAPRDDGPLPERVVEDGAWSALTVAAGDAAAEVPDVLSLDLEAGAVPGAGVTLHPAAAAPGPAERSETALRPAVRVRSVLLGEAAARAPGGRREPVRRPPLPVAGADDGPPPGAADAVVVEGVHCPRGHLTDPDRPACLTCGAPLSPDAQRVRGPRPPLGVLVTDGGTFHPGTGDLVIGREPQQAPEVLAGRARALPLRDAARSTSRVHARLTVRGWTVELADASSANGTFVSGHGAAGPWLPAVAGSPLRLAHGDRIRVGGRQLLFDAWRDAAVPPASR